MNLICDNRACCLYRSKNATSGPRDEEHIDDVLHSYSSINFTLGIILGVILLITADIPHYGKLLLINIFKFLFYMLITYLYQVGF